ncbi:MAG: ribosome recycling factor [Proteobacteria bacterium]|nr:ribosome recycling factor [Pseudomonadota bacterium]
MTDTIVADTQSRMEKAESSLRHELSTLRTGRATPDILNGVMVDAYGSKMPLAQVGNISIVDTRMLSVTVWDMGMVEATDKAIRESGLGLNPSYEGSVIRIPLPELTEDRRKELVKIAHQYTENGKIAIRNIRRDAMDKIKKDDDLSEDEQRKLQDEIQKLTDAVVKKADSILAEKEKDILTV